MDRIQGGPGLAYRPGTSGERSIRRVHGHARFHDGAALDAQMVAPRKLRARQGRDGVADCAGDTRGIAGSSISTGAADASRRSRVATTRPPSVCNYSSSALPAPRNSTFTLVSVVVEKKCRASAVSHNRTTIRGSALTRGRSRMRTCCARPDPPRSGREIQAIGAWLREKPCRSPLASPAAGAFGSNRTWFHEPACCVPLAGAWKIRATLMPGRAHVRLPPRRASNADWKWS
jgi:hypothetical protein